MDLTKTIPQYHVYKMWPFSSQNIYNYIQYIFFTNKLYLILQLWTLPSSDQSDHLKKWCVQFFPIVFECFILCNIICIFQSNDYSLSVLFLLFHAHCLCGPFHLKTGKLMVLAIWTWVLTLFIFQWNYMYLGIPPPLNERSP